MVTSTVASPIGHETLDDPAADPAVVHRMLSDIARANRWFGGGATLTRGLASLLGPDDRGRTVTLLDVGTGAGDLPHAAARWGARHGIRIVPVGVERSRPAARLAASNGVPTVVACGTMLPFGAPLPRSAAEAAARHDAPSFRPPSLRPPGSVDIVLLSQLLHHFDDATAVVLLREANAVARRGVIVADLRPSRSAARLFRAASLVLRFDRATIDDGITSLARGRDAAATAALACRAGAGQPLARNLPMARVLVAWRCDH